MEEVGASSRDLHRFFVTSEFILGYNGYTVVVFMNIY